MKQTDFTPELPVAFEMQTVEDFLCRWHPYATIYYILSGSLSITVREHTFELDADKLILINPYEMHGAKAQGCKCIVFRIDYSRFDSSVIPNDIFLDCNSLTASEQAGLLWLKHLLASIVKASAAEDKISRLLNKSHCYALMHHLLLHYAVQANADTAERQSQLARMEDILRYCTEHFAEGITLGSLAERFYLTPPYMSRLFKQAVGTTFSEYMDGLRLEHVLLEIGRRELSAEDLAERNGFPSGRSMIAAFRKKYGVSPSRYRATVLVSAAKQPDALNVGYSHDLRILAQYLEVSSSVQSNAAPPRRILELGRVNAALQTKGHPLASSIFKQCNIGNAKDLLTSEIQSTLRTVQKDLHFQVIGFHGLLDDGMMLYSESADGTPMLSFALIDRAFDFLREIQLSPILELSFMPSALAREGAHSMFYHKSIISLPNDYSKWRLLIQQLFKHLIARYGRENVAAWPVMLWSTPDSTTDEFGFGGLNAYFDFYKRTWDDIKEILPECNIELPSMRNYTLEENSEFPHFLTLCREAQCMPSAINISYFPINHIEQNLSTSVQTAAHLQFRTSPDALQECIAHIKRNSALQQWGDLPLRLSTWNSSLSHRDLLNDTAYKAAFIVKNALENCGEVEALGYWVVSDFVEEIQLSSDQYHGGLGLVTTAGIRKAAYYGYWALAQLGGTVLARKDGFIVTRSDNGDIQVLFYNYLHFNDLYAHGELFDMSFTKRYTAFSSRLQRKYVLPLEGLAEKNYLLCETTIGTQSGSSFDKWVEMGALPVADSGDVEYLNAVSLPRKKKQRVNCPDGQLTLARTLDAHEIRLIVLHPIIS